MAATRMLSAAGDRGWMEPGGLEVRWLSVDPVRLALAGDLDRSTYPAFARLLSQISERAPARLELDFSEVGLVDSRAAQWLHRHRTDLRCRGCDLVIRSASPWLTKVFAMLGMLDLISAN